MKERKQTSRDMRKQTEADIKYAYILARATRNMKTYHVVFCLNLTLAVCAVFRRLRARARVTPYREDIDVCIIPAEAVLGAA